MSLLIVVSVRNLKSHSDKVGSRHRQWASSSLLSSRLYWLVNWPVPQTLLPTKTPKAGFVRDRLRLRAG